MNIAKIIEFLHDEALAAVLREAKGKERLSEVLAEMKADTQPFSVGGREVVSTLSRGGEQIDYSLRPVVSIAVTRWHQGPDMRGCGVSTITTVPNRAMARPIAAAFAAAETALGYQLDVHDPRHMDAVDKVFQEVTLTSAS